MNIILYKNSSEPNRVDKTNYLTKSIDFVGTLRQATSMTNPQIVIELTTETAKKVVDSMNIDVVDSSNNLVYFVETIMFSENYAYIPQFNRYYFITDIISVRNNVWQINLHVDVLMTYKDSIKNLTAFVTRNAHRYRDDLVDEQLPLKSIPKVEIVTLSSDLDMNESSEDADNYVLTTLVNA